MTTATARRPRGVGFGTRVFLVCGGLIVFSVGAAVVTTAWRASRIARTTVQQALAASDSVQAALSRQQIAHLSEAARLVAGDPAFGAYVAEGDPASVRDLLDERRAAVGADILLAARADGWTLAASGDVSGDAARAFVDAALAGGEAGGVLASGRRVYIAAAAPIAAGGASVEGVLLAAREITPRTALDAKRASGADVVYFSLAGPEPAVAAGTLADAADDLPAALRGASDVWDAVQRGVAPAPRRVHLHGESWMASVRPLRDAGGAVHAVVVSLASPDRVVAPFRRIEWTLLVVGLLSIVVTFGVSYSLSRWLMRPVRALVAAAESARDGDFRHRITVTRGDEIGRLAGAFNALLADLRARREMEEFVAEIARSVPEPGDAAVLTRVEADAPTAVLAPDTTLALSDATLDAGPPPAVPAPSAFRPVDIGAVFARRYAMVGVLGEGAMGVVYKARDRELGEMVALKMLRPSRWGDDEDVERLKQELRLARRVTHPHVLRTYDFGVEGTLAFVTMEYVRGVSLRALLPHGSALPLAAGLRLARQIVSGVAAAHDAGIVHGDLKPENVLVELTGHAKIADFGLARPRRAARDGEAVVLAGTPHYMAPEHLQLAAAPDARGDIYACGVLFHELFTGQRAFRATTLEALLAEKIATPAPTPRQGQPSLPPALDALIAACMAVAPEARPASMHDIARALDHLQSS